MDRKEGGAEVAHCDEQPIKLGLVGYRAAQDGGPVVGVGEGRAAEPGRPMLAKMPGDAELVAAGWVPSVAATRATGLPYGRQMRVLGICFAGTSTPERAPMALFVSEVLGLPRRRVDGVEADLFALPDGSSFAVASPGGMGDSARSLGFLVESLDEAIAELTAAGVRTDEIATNDLERYVHFTAPDGHLYELVERL